MTTAKIEFSLGKFSFSGEGSEAWLGKQLELLLNQIPEMLKMPELSFASEQVTSNAVKPAASVTVGSLASHIKSKGGESNQVQRFMATADWLRLKGETNLKTGMVSKALSDNHQKKLGNPADCLNKSVAKGHCEKKGDGFFITPEGLKALGYHD